MEIIRWDEEGIQIYREGTEEWEQEGRTCSVEERWLKLKEKILSAMVRRRIKKGKRSWVIENGGIENARGRRGR